MANVCNGIACGTILAVVLAAGTVLVAILAAVLVEDWLRLHVFFCEIRILLARVRANAIRVVGALILPPLSQFGT